MERRSFTPPAPHPRLFNVKKPRLVRVKYVNIKLLPTLIPRPRSRSKEASETLPIDLGKFENGNDKNEASTRKYFVSVVYDCTKTMKKSESNGNQKIMRLFE